MSVALVQINLLWEQPDNNRVLIEQLLSEQITEPVDLIVLPELFTTGFTMNSEKFGEPAEGITYKWLDKLAKIYNAGIIGSYIVESGKKFYNRLVFKLPDKEYRYYDKRHLFRMDSENVFFSKGTARKVFEWQGWRICPQICYDLRFPVWSRNRNDYDVLLYIASWPASRSFVWRTLLTARAIENQSYTIGVNRVGSDGNNIDYCGNSLAVDPKGHILLDIKDQNNIIEKITLFAGEQDVFRKKFPVWKDGDNFTVIC
ncbi:MAG: amidohydrolase [Bacteroidales bacterium]|nr:amidohydrolase [Bacteroidales bacterium]